MPKSLIRPFMRDGKGGFVSSESRADQVSDRVGAIVAASGEVPWKPELDSHIDRVRGKSDTGVLSQFAQVYVQEVLAQHEPAVTGVAVTALREGETLTLIIDGELDGQMINVPVTL